MKGNHENRVFKEGLIVTVTNCHFVTKKRCHMEQQKLEWKVADGVKGSLLKARREDVVFIIYYVQPDINHTARWTLRIWDHGELMVTSGPALEPRALMGEAEAYQKWKREI